MPSNILIPTDGTPLSARAAEYGIKLAQQLGAKVTAVTITTPAEAIMVGEVMVVRDRKAYEEQAAHQARIILDPIEKVAKAAGVACEAVQTKNAVVWEGILSTAKQKGADMIVMASHGRRGLSALMISSETQKVVNHSHIPVVVFREAAT
jgi:nucleotide-binding universal stress UspA family protein